MKALEDKIRRDFGIVFSDSNLLKTAFTHTSYANEHRLLKVSHNERLEFLGDAVLQLLISQYLFKKYPNQAEGDLSKMRSMIVREESLASFSRQLGFSEYILLGRGEERSGGRERATILGDLFEAFLGALLLDKGVETVSNFINQVMIPQIEQGNFEKVRDYKTHLQELLQAKGEVDIDYQVVGETGPAHAKTFEVLVRVNQKEISLAKGRSKKLAEQEAAKKALERLERGDYVFKSD
ncbi:ribonuclease III [Streptococcus cuniculipharyngis]|uniref:Ribonuclease 3 n=1 Tax=Streptococcus cuniculipharyngis TaxID=1562651 RepID=A0A5C5SD81_9STRE|nr:ribonuclease III [Streptococcus cuniculipharyngis]TWS98689.1 ribonuclease III [Streptococcus cuniculipharyngis]